MTTPDLFAEPAHPTYPGAKATRKDAELYLVWRLNLTNPALAAFYVTGALKELLRAEIRDQHAARVAGSLDGKVEMFRDLWERIYQEPIEPITKRKRGKTL